MLDGRLKLRHLAVLASVAEHGSILRTAKAMHVTQPVVTRTIQEVETILKVPLFERHRRGVTPTAFGESFIADSRAILSQLRQAGQRIELLAGGELGSVTVGIGIHLDGSSSLVPRAIAALKAARPSVTVIVRAAVPELLQAGLLAGEIDLSFGRMHAQLPRRLAQEQMFSEPFRLIARPDHPAHRLVRPSLSELAEFAWIFPLRETDLRAELDALFRDAGVRLPEDRIECTSVPTMRYLLTETDVIALWPTAYGVPDRELRVIDVELGGLHRTIVVMHCLDHPLSPAASSLLHHLRAEAAQLYPRPGAST